MTKKLTPSEIGRALNAMRKTHGAGTGRPRSIIHDPDAAYCVCVECRKARGHYPPKASAGKKPTKNIKG